MSRTRADLIADVLANVGALDAQSTPSAEDSSFIDKKITSKVAELASIDTIYIGDDEEFEDDVFDSLSVLVAAMPGTAQAFGITGQKKLELTADAQNAMMKLRKITAAKPKYHVLKTEYF